VADRTGGGEQSLDVLLVPEVGLDGPDAEFVAYSVESVRRASGDGNFAALGNQFGGERAAHARAAADDHHVFLHLFSPSVVDVSSQPPGASIHHDLLTNDR
jgi:hypothetical protein